MLRRTVTGVRTVLAACALALLAACDSNEVKPQPVAPFPAREFCVDAITEWREREEGDAAHTIQAGHQTEAVCDVVIERRGRDY